MNFLLRHYLRFFGLPTKMKYEKSLREWMGLSAKTTAYLYNKYGAEEAESFWRYNIEVMKPFWKNMGIDGTQGFMDAMIGLADVMKNKVVVLENDNSQVKGIILKCGIKEAAKEYDYLKLPVTFPCEMWCEPFWKRISDSLGLESTREVSDKWCQFTVRDERGRL